MDVRLDGAGTSQGGAPGGGLTCQFLNPRGGEGDPATDPAVLRPRVAVHGFFRGQRFGSETQVELHRAADVVVTHRPRPESAGLAVRTEAPVRTRYGTAQGAIAFVLDASGSMGPPEGQPADASTKYVVASKALERVLRELPAGLIVSVYLFGAARPNYAAVAAEETIDTVYGPARWNPAQAADIARRVDAATPWDESPIVRTIVKARNDLNALGEIGFKSIVVVTDGDDNRFEKDKVLNPQGQSIPAFLSETFKEGKVQVNVVGFRAPDPATEAKMKAQFKSIETLPIPGKFYYLDDLQSLGINLQVVTRQELTYRLVPDDRDAAAAPAGDLDVPVGRLEDDAGWYPGPLPAGGYRVGLTGDPRGRREVALDGGDQLLLSLSEKAGSLTLTRLFCPTERFPGRQPYSRTAGPWRLTAYSGGISPDRSLRVDATLERDPAFDPPTVRIPRPREVLFELSPEGGGTGAGGRPLPSRYRWADWSENQGFPAPAWSFIAPAWPSADPEATDSDPARPVLHAWWLEQGEGPSSALLRADTDFVVDAPGTLDRVIDAGGVRVGLSSVRTENHRVETGDGEVDEKPCLVVRLTYPPRHRVWARPRDVAVSGYEHRFYTAEDGGGYYTGVFWTKTPSEVLERVRRIELVEEQSFKAARKAVKTIRQA